MVKLVSKLTNFKKCSERNCEMKRAVELPASPTPRRELSDTPVKLCNEISRLFRFRIRQTEGQEGVMSQQGAHLVLSVLAIVITVVK